jgi:outer membrane protein TolC
LHWEVAGIVRQALWNVALAENDHELAEQSLETAARLVAIVERRFELGDVAERDLLLAQASYLEYQTALIEAGAALLDAERTYLSVTGLNKRPEFVAEALSDTSTITAAHPSLALADIAVERAEAEVAVVRKTGNAGPTVQIGTRRERPALGTSFDDSIGVTVNVPFGGRAHRDTQIMTEARVASATRAARNRELRMLTLEMHEAAHGLVVVRESYAAASQRLEIAERHLAMGELAYEKGEIELIDLLKIKETAIAARRHAMRLQIDEKRQMALYNQAVGELP